jgi:hypothetical protein
MPPIGNRGGDSEDTSATDDTTAPAEVVPTDPTPAPPVDPAPEPVEKDDRVSLQLVNTFGDGDTFVHGDYIVKTTPTLVPPDVADEIVAAAASAGVQVVNLGQEG